jgi:hypothetical protein
MTFQHIRVSDTNSYRKQLVGVSHSASQVERGEDPSLPASGASNTVTPTNRQLTSDQPETHAAHEETKGAGVTPTKATKDTVGVTSGHGFDYFKAHNVFECPDPDDWCAHCHICGDLIDSFTQDGQVVCKQHQEVPLARTRNRQPRPSQNPEGSASRTQRSDQAVDGVAGPHLPSTTSTRQ